MTKSIKIEIVDIDKWVSKINFSLTKTVQEWPSRTQIGNGRTQTHFLVKTPEMMKAVKILEKSKYK